MTATCPKCLGEGRVANSDEQEPWSAWESLPPGSDIAVRLGLVQPMPCPECDPTKEAPATTAPRDLVAEARALAAEIHPGHRYLAAPINRQMATAGNLLTELADEIEGQRPRAIDNPDELGDLPINSTVIRPNGEAAQKTLIRIGKFTAWCKPGAKPLMSAVDVLADGPVLLIYVGEAQ